MGSAVVGVAASGPTNSQIRVCSNARTATIRFVAAPAKCRPGERLRVWNTRGLPGVAGAAGINGLAGLAGTNGTNGTSGATGAQGLVGATGLAGPSGDTGATGATGTQGEVGATGPQGDTGATGPQGIQGIQGDTGSTGDSIVMTPVISGGANCFSFGGVELNVYNSIGSLVSGPAYICSAS